MSRTILKLNFSVLLLVTASHKTMRERQPSPLTLHSSFMNHCRSTLLLLLSLLGLGIQAEAQKNYINYHHTIVKCELLVSEQSFTEAVNLFDSLFTAYEFVFLRDCKLAAEIASLSEDKEAFFRFVRKGIKNGWTLKEIRKGKRFTPFLSSTEWNRLVEEYDNLRSVFIKRMDTQLRTEVRQMLKNDQKMAFRAFIRIGDKKQTAFAENRFAPHSEKQLAQLNQLLNSNGYPGERLIGNGWWTSVILSHHNSISKTYNTADTLYLAMRPRLLQAILDGNLHPYDFAIIEDWRKTTLTGHNTTNYGYLGKIEDSEKMKAANSNRAAIGLRSVELRNRLIVLENDLDANFHLPRDWQKGAISLAQSK